LILGLAVLCSAYGFTTQALAQQYTTPEKVGLFFSLEPVFSALLAALFLHEILTIPMYVGAIVILIGIFGYQLGHNRQLKHSPN
jgi:drug/metabolite transporter (DMT)-like permease